MPAPSRSALEVLAVALRLGLTSFGGPVAHIAYFRREYVEHRQWLDDATFAELVALCQSLPGPASSQLGFAIGTIRAGIRGGISAWIGFTLPSAVALIAFALVAAGADLTHAAWAHGLKLAAVAVVALALWQMRRTLAPDWPRRGVAVLALAAALVVVSPFAPLAIIVAGGAVGIVVERWRGDDGAAASPPSTEHPGARVSRRAGISAFTIFLVLLVALPVVRATANLDLIASADTFFRTGALVFGGGHVVLPLLHESVVVPGWVDEQRFVAGYGAAQAVPGPLFTFAGYLGAISSQQPAGVLGGIVALVSIFLPGLLLISAALPFWDRVRASGTLRGAIAGTGAAVVGILAAALYDPVWRSAVTSAADVVVIAIALVALIRRAPPLAVVLGCALAAEALRLGAGQPGAG